MLAIGFGLDLSKIVVIPFNNPFPPQKTDSEQLSTHRTCSTKILSFRDSALVGKNQK